MSRTTKAISVFLQIKELVGALAAIALWILSLWLAGQLSPLVQGIEFNTHNIEAHERRIGVVENNYENIRDDITVIREDVGTIKGYLEAKKIGLNQ